MRIETTDWTEFGTGTQVPGHVLAIGDVHGRADLLAGLLDHFEALPRHGDRHLVFTGDLHDRGPEGLRAIRLAWEARHRFEARTYLAGNHEITFMTALTDPQDGFNFKWWFESYRGYAVCDEVDPAGKLGVTGLIAEIRARLPDGFLDHIARAPGHVQIGDLLFVHAGLIPIGNRAAFLALGPMDDHPQGQHWAYIREPFLTWRMGWDQQGPGPTIVVHGHSIENPGPLENGARVRLVCDRVRDLRRINLDTGAVFHGHLVGLEAIGDRYRFHVAREEARWQP